MPTIKAKSEFDVKLDAELLHAILQPVTAKKAPDATVRSLIHILTTRSYDQRQSVVVTYREFYGRYIAQDIRACVSSGCLRDGLLTLVRPYPVRDATAIHKALTGVGKDQHTLLEILCARNWEELQEICKSYKELFKIDLSKTIKSEVFGKLEGFLQMMLRERRSEAPVEDVRVREAVRDLFDVTCGKWGKDKHLIATMFLRESYPQLRQVFREYKRRYGQSIHTLISRHMSGQTARMIALIARFVESEIHFYAHILHRAVNGDIGDKSALHRAVMGNTGEKAALMRVLLRLCDVNLVQVIETYHEQYGTSLRDDLSMCTHGDFRDLLMAVCGWPWPVRGGLLRTSSMLQRELEAEDEEEADEPEGLDEPDILDEIEIGDSPPVAMSGSTLKIPDPDDLFVLPSSEGEGPWAITPSGDLKEKTVVRTSPTRPRTPPPPRSQSATSVSPGGSPTGSPTGSPSSGIGRPPTPPPRSPSWAMSESAAASPNASHSSSGIERGRGVSPPAHMRRPLRLSLRRSRSPLPGRLTPRAVSPAPPVTRRSTSPPTPSSHQTSPSPPSTLPPEVAVNGDS